MKGMHRENTGMFADFEYNDLASLCVTGGGFAEGMQVQQASEDYAWFDDVEIGNIDSPEYIAAGGCEFMDNALATGVFQKIVRREQ